MSQDDEGLLADNSIDVPLLDFYTKHRPLPSGKPLAKLLFYYLIATAHEYYSLQLSRRYSTMFLCIVNEADMGAHLQVAALSTHTVLNVEPIPDPDATPEQASQTKTLTNALQAQATLKERNPPRLLSVALQFYPQDGGAIFTFNHLIDMQCRVCGKLGTATCSRCHTARYCSKPCQEMHWKAGHKAQCNPLME